MIDFSTLQGLTIPEGVVTQITDANGRVLWAVSGGKVVLEVEKITSNTYAGETTYNNEQFILLDIYLKTNGTAKVTYGGLTKTITDTSGAEEPNAQKVFFGTFNGVSDSVETPASGTLTIEGDYVAFAQASWATSSKSLAVGANSPCITQIKDFGKPLYIPAYAFIRCVFTDTNVTIPNSVTRIYASAFNATNLASVTILSGVTHIELGAFVSCSSLKTVKILATTPPELVDATTAVTHFGDPTADYFALEKIIVPKGCGNAYRTAEGWTTYTDYIVEAS